MAFKDPEKQKEAQRKHYENNKEIYAARDKARKKHNRQWLHEYKTNKPCLDCGIIYPYYVMDFDHRDPSTKKGNLGNMVGYSLPMIQEEVAKCDLICSNCHRIRTHN